MKKIFYEKKGRRYVPVSEYDSEWIDAFPKGAHLVMCYPGGTSRRFNVDPAYAPMIAAGRVAEDAISKALLKTSDLRMQKTDREKKLTPSQHAAWENLVKEFGPTARQLEWPSCREIAEEGVKAMAKEAENFMRHESVRKAYDHFILMCELVKENENKNS